MKHKRFCMAYWGGWYRFWFMDGDEPKFEFGFQCPWKIPHIVCKYRGEK